MGRIIQNLFHETITFFHFPCPIVLFGEIQVSKADLSRKLDLILEKVSGLEKRVAELESESASVQQEVKQVAQTASKGLAIPKDPREKESFFKRMKNEITS